MSQDCLLIDVMCWLLFVTLDCHCDVFPSFCCYFCSISFLLCHAPFLTTHHASVSTRVPMSPPQGIPLLIGGKVGSKITVSRCGLGLVRTYPRVQGLPLSIVTRVFIQRVPVRNPAGRRGWRCVGGPKVSEDQRFCLNFGGEPRGPATPRVESSDCLESEPPHKPNRSHRRRPTRCRGW